MIQQFHFWHMYQKDMKWLSQKDMCTSKLIAVLFIMAKIWKQPKCSLTNKFSGFVFIVHLNLWDGSCWLNIKIVGTYLWHLASSSEDQWLISLIIHFQLSFEARKMSFTFHFALFYGYKRTPCILCRVLPLTFPMVKQVSF